MATACGSKAIKIAVFYGSTRAGRNLDRVAKLVNLTVQDKGVPVELHVIDPLEIPFETLKVPLHFMGDPSQAPEWMSEVNETLKNADGILLISSEYNATIPPALSNMIDHFSPSVYRHKPAAVITYSMGAYGGVRAHSSLFSLLNEIGCLIVPSTCSIPKVHQVLNESGTTGDESLAGRVEKVLRQLHWYAAAVKGSKVVGPIPE